MKIPCRNLGLVYVALVFGLSSVACHHTRRFENLGHVGGGKSFWAVLKWKLAFAGKEWPEMVLDNVPPELTRPLADGVAHVTFINHATELIQLNGLTVLTDPVFSERVSPFSWIGPKRHRRLGATFAEIPKIDVVVISHNHFDHMDLPSLQEIEKRDHPKFIVALGNKKILQDAGLVDVVELDWWNEVKLERGTVTLVPMQHWSRRGLNDRNRALWGGYVIEVPGLKILFAGDTGYGEQFKAIEKNLARWI